MRTIEHDESKTRSRRASGVLAAAAAVALAAVATAAPSQAAPVTPKVGTGPLLTKPTPQAVPNPPNATPALSGTPAAQAQQVQQALASSDMMTRSGGIIAALRAAGVPVILPTGTPITGTGTDPYGLPWTQIVASQVAGTTAMRLADALHLFDMTSQNSANAISKSEQLRFLAAVRTAATGAGTDPAIAFVANLLLATNKRLGGPNPTPTTSTASLFIDAPTLEVLTGVFLRVGFYDLATAPHPNVAAPRHAAATAVIPPDCAALTTTYASWFEAWVSTAAARASDLADNLQLVTPRWRDYATMLGRASDQIRASVTAATSKASIVAALSGPAIGTLAMLQYAAEVAMLDTHYQATDAIKRSTVAGAIGNGTIGGFQVTVSYASVAERTASSPWLPAAMSCGMLLSIRNGDSTFMPKQGPVGDGVRVVVTGKTGFAAGSVPAVTDTPYVAFSPNHDTNVSAAKGFGFTNTDSQIEFKIAPTPITRDRPSDAWETPRPLTVNVAVGANQDPFTKPKQAERTVLDAGTCLHGSASAGFTVATCGSIMADILQSTTYAMTPYSFGILDHNRSWTFNFLGGVLAGGTQYPDLCTAKGATKFDCTAPHLAVDPKKDPAVILGTCTDVPSTNWSAAWSGNTASYKWTFEFRAGVETKEIWDATGEAVGAPGPDTQIYTSPSVVYFNPSHTTPPTYMQLFPPAFSVWTYWKDTGEKWEKQVSTHLDAGGVTNWYPSTRDCV